MECPDDQCASELRLLEPSDDHPSVLRLREILASCSKSIETGDHHQSSKSVSELAGFLDSISDAAELDADNEDAKNNAFLVLSEIFRYISSPSSDQETIDALSFELPKALSKFVMVDKCLEIVENVIDHLTIVCGPRDMLSILCEALDSVIKTTSDPRCIAILLNGLSKVVPSIQRRHFEQLKVAVPVILNALKALSSKSYDIDSEIGTLYDRAIDIAKSIHAVCSKLEGKVKEKLQSLLGLYVLQIMALASVAMSYNHPLTLQLSRFLPYCGLTYLGLITGTEVDKVTSSINGDDEDDYIDCFSYIKHGASISVIWAHISNEVAEAAEENLTDLIFELQNNQCKRWEAIGMLKNILSLVSLPWELKKDAVDFLLHILPENVAEKFGDKQIDCLSYMPSLFAALQALQMVIIYTSDSELRKMAYSALQKLLADIPISQSFDIIKALITNSESSSMIAIILGLAKEKLARDIQRIRAANDGQGAEVNPYPQPSFWTPSVLEFVELVLRPPNGGPPRLPEQSDAILSALNLYRYIQITESTGESNYTGVLSKNNLQKVKNEWLLPLRALVMGLKAENKSDYDQHAVDTECALNPLEFVLYRCIELVEEKL